MILPQEQASPLRLSERWRGLVFCVHYPNDVENLVNLYGAHCRLTMW